MAKNFLRGPGISRYVGCVILGRVHLIRKSVPGEIQKSETFGIGAKKMKKVPGRYMGRVRRSEHSK